MPAALRPAEPASRGALAGIGLMVLASLLLSVMDGMVKWLSAAFPTTHIVFYRQLFGLLPLVVLLSRDGGLAALRTRRPGLHLARGLFGCGAATAFFYAFKVMPLADAYAIAFTAPLLVTALSMPVLGERVGPRRWAAVLAGFAGVLIVLGPATGIGLGPGPAAALAGAFCYAMLMLLARRMRHTETGTATVLYTAVVMILANGLTLPIDFRVPTGAELGLLVLTGLIGGCGVIALTYAFRLAAAAVLAPIQYLDMVWALAIGFAIWNDVPTAGMLGGAAVIAASGLYILHREARAPAPAHPSAPVAATDAEDKRGDPR